MASYAYPDVLVETQWVADHLDDPNVCLIEAAYDTEKPKTRVSFGENRRSISRAELRGTARTCH